MNSLLRRDLSGGRRLQLPARANAKTNTSQTSVRESKPGSFPSNKWNSTNMDRQKTETLEIKLPENGSEGVSPSKSTEQEHGKETTEKSQLRRQHLIKTYEGKHLLSASRRSKK